MKVAQEIIPRVLARSSPPGSCLLVDSIRAAVAEIDRLRTEVAKYDTKVLFVGGGLGEQTT